MILTLCRNAPTSPSNSRSRFVLPLAPSCLCLPLTDGAVSQATQDTLADRLRTAYGVGKGKGTTVEVQLRDQTFVAFPFKASHDGADLGPLPTQCATRRAHTQGTAGVFARLGLEAFRAEHADVVRFRSPSRSLP